MRILYFIGFIILFLISITVYYGKKLANPYKLYFIFGKKGSGKSTTLAMLAYKYSKKGYKIYCSEPNIPNTYYFDIRSFGFFRFDSNSVVLIDECSTIWGNRDFRSFKREVELQFRMQRHDKLIIYLFSQTFDVDKKIRDLADGMFLAEKRLNCIVWLKRILKNPTLTEASSEGESRITENLQFDSFLLWPFGSRKLIWIPRYIKLFDSFAGYDDARPPMEAAYTYTASCGLRLPIRFLSSKKKAAAQSAEIESEDTVSDSIDKPTAPVDPLA